MGIVAVSVCLPEKTRLLAFPRHLSTRLYPPPPVDVFSSCHIIAIIHITPLMSKTAPRGTLLLTSGGI